MSSTVAETQTPDELAGPPSHDRDLSSPGSAALFGAALGALAGFLTRDLDLPALISFEHSCEPLVVIFMLLGGAVAVTRLRWVLATITAALALLWCVVAFSTISGWLSRGLVRTDPPERADAVFVSLSSLRPGPHSMGEVQNRLVHGIQLVALRKAPRLVLTESREVPGVAFARLLMENPLVVAELAVAGRAENTHEEAVAVAQLARQRGFKRILLVTSPIHSLRASGAFEKEGLAVISSPSIETRFDLETLDRWRDRLSAFGSVMHERVGLWVYARRGWLSKAADRP
jgi:uncharacterized SAM-binding protein YcdF (DUF218 family)